MLVQMAWVKPPPQIGGLDHLAVQATCINIYSRMLPGITNVTDRARYYSFYPWLIWAFGKAGHTKYDDEFIERFRRADCLFSLIALRHASVSDGEADDHAAAMVGSITLSSVARSIADGATVRLSDYSLRSGATKRYFANWLGGLGQYYLGVLRELRILDGDTSRGINYTREIGQAIAEKMDASVDRTLFMKVVDADSVTAAELDQLHSFCPCHIAERPEEQKILSDLFFARGPFEDSEALPRRRTLHLILNLAQALGQENHECTEERFRACCYTQSLPSGQSWQIPDVLMRNRGRWATYARNELLSLAVQGLFYVVLDAYAASGLRLETSADIADWYLTQPEAIDALEQLGSQETFADLVAVAPNWLPEFSSWTSQMHEVQLTEEIFALSHREKTPESRQAIVVAALRTILALAARGGQDGNQYSDLIFEADYFRYYPINLQSFAQRASDNWASLRMPQLLRWLLLNWGIEMHLRVALRKLRGQSQSTFRIRPSDRGMEVVAIPPAVHTRPRFAQALRVLKDIGALKRDPTGSWQLSSIGLAIMEHSDAP
ncbi:hypothetical protein QM467_15840 [Rhodoblastus sp. 17X3]|uniref:hypothetical protein n=1 Tax=Rhodoblastus sp. 17X3 TaxID=3047026 RepID=UPI0024B6EF5D|nr:hypothetical protein [Rhodoblastus sp. 17X3]MDI9849527.1 hypothetical protein [Rhodoblastus sp. 17X3]